MDIIIQFDYIILVTANPNDEYTISSQNTNTMLYTISLIATGVMMLTIMMIIIVITFVVLQSKRRRNEGQDYSIINSLPVYHYSN